MSEQVKLHPGNGLKGEDTISVRLGDTDHHRSAKEWLRIAQDIRQVGMSDAPN